MGRPNERVGAVDANNNALAPWTHNFSYCTVHTMEISYMH
jgi:hypothetical protein